MAAKNNFPWQAPIVMLSSMIVALCLGVGHHLFYSALHGQQVPGNVRNIAGWSFTSQQINTAAGTAFAFLFKAILTVAASTAYIQLFFRAVGTRESNLKSLDHLFSGFKDLLSLLRLTTYWSFPVLFLVALTIWLVPLAAIFSPAALSVQFDAVQPPPTNRSQDTQPAFSSLAFRNFAVEQSGADMIALSPTDTSDEVSRVVRAVLAAGDIAAIAPPGANASWTTKLQAPRLACESITDDSFHQELKSNLQGVLNHFSTNGTGSSDLMFSYLSWTNESQSSNMPFVISPQVGLALQASNDVVLNVPHETFVDLYLAVFSRAASSVTPALWNATSAFTDELMDWYFEDATLLHCWLEVANYTLRFTYNGTNQAQYIEVLQRERVPIGRRQHDGVYIHHYSDDNITVTPLEVGALEPWEVDNLEPLAQLSYGGIYKEFWIRLVGATNQAGSGLAGSASLIQQGNVNDTNMTESRSMSVTTDIFSTSLVETEELKSLEEAEFLPNALNETTLTWLRSIMSPTQAIRSPPGSRQPLKEALEELFFNVTMSMMSSKDLLYNATSPFAPPDIDVTYNLFGNIYVYSPERLWLPYGLALGVVLLDVAVGLWAIFALGVSYSANFSTVFRIAKSTDVKVDAFEADCPGKDPLPKAIGEATLTTRRKAYVEVSQGE